MQKETRHTEDLLRATRLQNRAHLTCIVRPVTREKSMALLQGSHFSCEVVGDAH